MKVSHWVFIVTLLVLGLALTLVFADAGLLDQKEELGKAIFFDEDLSINRNQSCATCHMPSVGFVGPTSEINAHGAVYEGSIPGAFGDRKPPSAAYATTSPILHFEKGLWIGGNFWDGRATGERLGNPAADQAQGPFLNPKEQALPDSACVVYRVCTETDYLVGFDDVYADGCDIGWPAGIDEDCAAGFAIVLADAERAKSNLAYDNIALAIAAYEGSPEVNSYSSKWDYARMDLARLDKQERKGFALFQGKATCKACHVSQGEFPLFTDYSFDNLGVPKNPENPFYIDHPDFVDPGLGGFLKAAGYEQAVYDLEWGKQKVPTLRNVALRPDETVVKDYGHNGYFKSLYGIVHFYNTRDILPVCPGDYTEAEALAANCWPEPEVAMNVNTAELGDLGLTYEEELALVAFLETLDDGHTPWVGAPNRIVGEMLLSEFQSYLPTVRR